MPALTRATDALNLGSPIKIHSLLARVCMYERTAAGACATQLRNLSRQSTDTYVPRRPGTARNSTEPNGPGRSRQGTTLSILTTPSINCDTVRSRWLWSVATFARYHAGRVGDHEDRFVGLRLAMCEITLACQTAPPKIAYSFLPAYSRSANIVSVCQQRVPCTSCKNMQSRPAMSS